ncbi:hypothetical protein DET60_105377 [Raoultella planticola]|nr:hypothetical protein DFO76_104422 [Raoultella planticola]TDX37493.1 hypothetical protein DET60_105377 [Raoultella planticola]SPZ28610.1 Uncharacterised protein [Raoultella planticola]
MISTTDISGMARCGIAVTIAAQSNPMRIFYSLKNILNATAPMNLLITALPMRQRKELHLTTSIYAWGKTHYNVEIFINIFASAA